MHTETTTATTQNPLPLPARAALPAPRPESCDACERPLEHHEVAVFELRGTPVLGLCVGCLLEGRG